MAKNVSNQPQYTQLSELGFDIREARKEKGLSQMDVAKACKVSIVTYQRWESGGTRAVAPENFERLVDVLG